MNTPVTRSFRRLLKHAVNDSTLRRNHRTLPVYELFTGMFTRFRGRRVSDARPEGCIQAAWRPLRHQISTISLMKRLVLPIEDDGRGVNYVNATPMKWRWTEANKRLGLDDESTEY